MADTGLRRGVDLYHYINTGSYNSPVWVQNTRARDVGVKVSRTKIDSSKRGFSNVKTTVSGLIDLQFDVEMLYDESDTVLSTLQAAAIATTIAGNTVENAFSDGPIAGSGIRYWRAICAITDDDEPEPLDGIKLAKFSMTPTEAANAPTVNTA